MKGNYNNTPEQLDRLEEARKQWKESEWRLQFLRTQKGSTSPERTEEQLLEWMQQCQNPQ